MRNQSETSWTDVVTAIVAIVAIILSCVSLWQSNASIQVAKESNKIAEAANQLAKDSSSPNLKIISISDEPTWISATHCYINSTRSGAVYLRLRATHKITLTNNGGLAASLITTLFSENGTTYREVQIYKSENNKISQDRINLPLKIEPGEAIEVFLQAFDATRPSPSSKLSETEIGRLQSDNLQGVWILYFSNESNVTNETVAKYQNDETFTCGD